MRLLEVNDTLIRLWQDGTLRYAEPGIAQVERNSLTFGTEALNQAFVHPVQSLSSYWQRLNEEPSEQRNNTVSKQSDLIFSQLNEVFGQDSQADDEGVWVALASDIDAQQAGLLYGILEYKRLKLRGFIDLASATAAIDSLPNRVCHVDMHLHRTVVTELTLNEDTIEVGVCKSLSQLGYLQLINRWINTVAERSLDESRFDPRVSGLTEQQVFDQLHQGINSIEETIFIEIAHNNQLRSIGVPRSDLIAGSEGFYERMLAPCGNHTHIVLSEHASKLPGLADYIEKSGYGVDRCNDQNLYDVVSRVDTQTASDADIEFFKTYSRIAASVEPNLDPNQPPTSPDQCPTHVLVDDVAFPISNESRLRIGEAVIGNLQKVDGHLRLIPADQVAVVLNNTPVTEPANIQIGDQLNAAVYGRSLAPAKLITVIESG